MKLFLVVISVFLYSYSVFAELPKRSDLKNSEIVRAEIKSNPGIPSYYNLKELKISTEKNSGYSVSTDNCYFKD